MEIREFHSDNGGEYVEKEYLQQITASGARRSFIVAKCPNHNPIAEGAFWRIFSKIRAFIADSGIPMAHWGKLFYQACYVLNREPRQVGKQIKSPYELVYKRRYNASRIKVPGCLAHAFINKKDREGKLSAITFPGFHISVSREHRGWDIFNPVTNQYIVSRSVQFFENIMYKDRPDLSGPTRPSSGIGMPTEEDDSSGDEGPNKNTSNNSDTSSLRISQRLSRGGRGDPSWRQDPSKCMQYTHHLGTPDQEIEGHGEYPSAHHGSLMEGVHKTPSPTKTSNHNTTLWNEVDKIKPLHTRNMTKKNTLKFRNMLAHCIALTLNEDEIEPTPCTALQSAIGPELPPEPTDRTPKNIFQALTCPKYGTQWRKSISEEIEAQMAIPTWKLIPLSAIPKGRKIVGATWCFKIKRDKHGKINRFKARLCAQGFSQDEGFDYHITFSNTVRYDSLRLVMSIAADLGLRLTSIDIKTAYVNGTLKEMIIMRLPQGGRIWATRLPTKTVNLSSANY
jgi:hypothetical protein